MIDHFVSAQNFSVAAVDRPADLGVWQLTTDRG
jgi:hypothetical protein